MIPDALSFGQYQTVYNFLSLVIAAQLFTAVFLVIALPRILPRYRQAITVAIVVCGIAAYHYFRIFDSFKAAFVTDSVGGTGTYTQAVGEGFNDRIAEVAHHQGDMVVRRGQGDQLFDKGVSHDCHSISASASASCAGLGVR